MTQETALGLLYSATALNLVMTVLGYRSWRRARSMATAARNLQRIYVEHIVALRKKYPTDYYLDDLLMEDDANWQRYWEEAEGTPSLKR